MATPTRHRTSSHFANITERVCAAGSLSLLPHTHADHQIDFRPEQPDGGMISPPHNILRPLVVAKARHGDAEMLQESW